MNSWPANRAALLAHLERDDLSRFLEWSTIRATMYVGMGAAYMPKVYEEIETDWDRWGPVVRWTGLGGDAYHSGNGYASDPNLIHQAYHLKQWLDRTRQDLSRMRSIIEFGAGYGAMALICRRLGFEGRYYIIDLPELTQIQAYYLNQVAPEYRGVTHWMHYPQTCDLLIACHSINEIPLTEREVILSQTKVREYLFASSYEFDGVDNQVWFQQMGGTAGYDWQFKPHRWQENAFYMTGVEL